MALIDLLIAENSKLNTHLEGRAAVDLPDNILLRILIIKFLLGQINLSSSGGSSTISTNTSIDFGAGATTAKTQRVVIASDNTPTVLLGAGSNAIGSISNTSFASTQSGTWNINNIAGTVSLPTGAAISANQIPAFTLSPVTLGSANAANLKASAGKVYSLFVTNKNTSTRHLQIINKASTPTNSDSALIMAVYSIPPQASIIIDGSYFGANGLVCSTGVSWAFSSTDTTITLATATDALVQVGYL